MPLADRIELAAVVAGLVMLVLAFIGVCVWATRIKRRIENEE